MTIRQIKLPNLTLDYNESTGTGKVKYKDYSFDIVSSVDQNTLKNIGLNLDQFASSLEKVLDWDSSMLVSTLTSGINTIEIKDTKDFNKGVFSQDTDYIKSMEKSGGPSGMARYHKIVIDESQFNKFNNIAMESLLVHELAHIDMSYHGFNVISAIAGFGSNERNRETYARKRNLSYLLANILPVTNYKMTNKFPTVDELLQSYSEKTISMETEYYANQKIQTDKILEQMSTLSYEEGLKLSIDYNNSLKSFSGNEVDFGYFGEYASTKVSLDKWYPPPKRNR